MTKPRLVKVRALFYVFMLVAKEAAPILTQPHLFYLVEEPSQRAYLLEVMLMRMTSSSLRSFTPAGAM